MQWPLQQQSETDLTETAPSILNLPSESLTIFVGLILLYLISKSHAQNFKSHAQNLKSHAQNLIVKLQLYKDILTVEL